MRIRAVMIATAIFYPVVMATVAVAQPSNGDFVLRYRPSDGDLTLAFTGTGASGAGPVSLQMLNVLTLGNGNDTTASGPAMPSGIPNVTPGQGGLNGSRATLPPAAIQTFNSGVGASGGLNGVFSEIYNASIGSTWITFSAAGTSSLDLGAVAATGWTQANIDSIFVTNSDASPNSALNYGYFLYAQDTGGAQLGRVEVVSVPEPTIVIAAAVTMTAGIAIAKRRRLGAAGKLA